MRRIAPRLAMRTAGALLRSQVTAPIASRVASLATTSSSSAGLGRFPHVAAMAVPFENQCRSMVTHAMDAQMMAEVRRTWKIIEQDLSTVSVALAPMIAASWRALDG